MERALVIDDDPVIGGLVKKLLELRCALDVLLVDDGVRATEALRVGGFDLVVSDIELPDADGLELARLAKSTDAHLPVIVMTGHASVDYAVRAVRHGVDEFVTKPLDCTALVATARRLLDVRAAHQANRPVVLAIGSHPDDVEIGCGGVLLKHRAAGHPVTVLTLSGGEQGGDKGERAGEARRAVEILDARLMHRDLPDTMFAENGATITAISEAIAEVQPTIVYTHSLHDNHQDHRSTYRATMVAARGVPHVYCYQSPSSGIEFRPARFVDVSEFMPTKIEALHAFRSQHAQRAYLADDFVVATARYWGRFGSGRYVEPLEIVRNSEAVAA